MNIVDADGTQRWYKEGEHKDVYPDAAIIVWNSILVPTSRWGFTCRNIA